MLLLANLAICLFLTGLIWTIQIIHYPLFLQIDENRFIRYIKTHQTKISPLVGPLMLLELFASVWLFINLRFTCTFIASAQFIFVIIIWLATFFIQIPLHIKLTAGFNRKLIQKLIKSNWIRTICWSFRTILLLTLVIIN